MSSASSSSGGSGGCSGGGAGMHLASPTGSAAASAAPGSPASPSSMVHCLVFMRSAFGTLPGEQNENAQRYIVGQLGADNIVPTRIYYHGHFATAERAKLGLARSQAFAQQQKQQQQQQQASTAGAGAGAGASAPTLHHPAGAPCLQKNCGQQRHSTETRIKKAGLDYTNVRRWILANKRVTFTNEVFRDFGTEERKTSDETDATSAVGAALPSAIAERIQERQKEFGFSDLPPSEHHHHLVADSIDAHAIAETVVSPAFVSVPSESAASEVPPVKPTSTSDVASVAAAPEVAPAASEPADAITPAPSNAAVPDATPAAAPAAPMDAVTSTSAAAAPTDAAFPKDAAPASAEPTSTTTTPASVAPTTSATPDVAAAPAAAPAAPTTTPAPPPKKPGLKVYVKSRQGSSWDPHKVNQDRPLACVPLRGHPGVHVYGVMDGHGHHGHYVSEYIMHQLPAFLAAEKTIRTETTQCIESAIAKLVGEIAHSDINLKFSGSTCVFGVHFDNKLVVANIGDSRCVVGRESETGDPETISLTTDHKPDTPSELQRILAAGGRVCPIPGSDHGPNRVWLANLDEPGLAMSRSIGDEVSQTVGVTSTPETVVHTLTERDRFCVFASDGVWEFMTNEEAVALVWRFLREPAVAVNQLVGEAVRRWQDDSDAMIDDITVVLVVF